MPTQTTLTSKKDVKTIMQAGAVGIYALDGDDVVTMSVFNAGGDLGNYVDGGAGNDTISDGHLCHQYSYLPLGPIGT
jgi:Ca2+-binding RTX toxin-like protein